jgi:hypothetical protein
MATARHPFIKAYDIKGIIEEVTVNASEVKVRPEVAAVVDNQSADSIYILKRVQCSQSLVNNQYGIRMWKPAESVDISDAGSVNHAPGGHVTGGNIKHRHPGNFQLFGSVE